MTNCKPKSDASETPRLEAVQPEGEDLEALPASSPLRATVHASVEPGPVVRFEGAMVGFPAFYEVRDIVGRVFDEHREPVPLAFDLCYVQTADPLVLSMFASVMQAAHRRGRRFRVLVPAGYVAEYLIPRLVASCAPYRVMRIEEYDAVAFDTPGATSE